MVRTLPHRILLCFLVFAVGVAAPVAGQGDVAGVPPTLNYAQLIMGDGGFMLAGPDILEIEGVQKSERLSRSGAQLIRINRDVPAIAERFGGPATDSPFGGSGPTTFGTAEYFEVVPVEVPSRKGSVTFEKDEHLRPGTTVEHLKKLPPVFRDHGTVHAGNSSGITDAASSVLVAGKQAVDRHGLEPMARIVAYSQSGVDPKIMGIGPVPATRQILEETGLTLDQIDLIELNEAFAAQVIACDRELHLDRSKLNVHGGSIALGHPIGCTGTRITTTLLHAMATHEKKLGLATLCISGGMGLALLLERV